jgi:hypothetical protein
LNIVSSTFAFITKPSWTRRQVQHHHCNHQYHQSHLTYLHLLFLLWSLVMKKAKKINNLFWLFLNIVWMKENEEWWGWVEIFK